MFAATARHVPHAHVGLSGLLFEFQNIEPRLAEISRVKFRCEPKHSLEVLELLDCAGAAEIRKIQIGCQFYIGMIKV
jgi:hypothetical protein